MIFSDFDANNFIETVASLTNSILPFVVVALTFMLSVFGFGGGKERRFNEIRLTLYRTFALAVIFPALLAFFYSIAAGIEDYSSTIATYYLFIAKQNWWVFPILIAIFLIRFFFLRTISPRISKWRRSKGVKQSEGSLSDIRDEVSRYSAKTFDPKKYYKKDHVFLGLDEKNKPIYITLAEFSSNHLQILGATGRGKGVFIGCVMDQLIGQGHTVFYFDPKHDANLPSVMHQACSEHGRDFTYISLYDNEPGEWGPFLGGDLDAARTRLEVALGLNLTGSDADYHKTRERKMAVDAFNQARDIDGLFSICEMKDNESRISTELGIWKRYRSISIRSGGLSIADSIANGAVVYVKGSLQDKIMLACFKAMLLEASQEIQRLATLKKKHVFMFFDEVSFYVTPEFPKSLATIRSFGMTFCIAHQSINDLKALEDQTVSSQYVYGSVDTNTQIKVVHGGFDDTTARWAAAAAGTITKEVSTKIDVLENSAAAQIFTDRSTITVQQEPLFPTNRLKLLPTRVALFIAPGQLPKLCFTCFVKIKDPDALKKFLANQTKMNDPKPEGVKTSDEITGVSEALSEANPFYNNSKNSEQERKDKKDI